MNIKDIFKNINFYDFQYDEGHFIRTNSFIKIKNKPNKLYNFNVSVKYCKCCNIIKTISVSKDNKHYFYDEENPEPNEEVLNYANHYYVNKTKIKNIIENLIQ